MIREGNDRLKKKILVTLIAIEGRVVEANDNRNRRLEELQDYALSVIPQSLCFLGDGKNIELGE